MFVKDKWLRILANNCLNFYTMAESSPPKSGTISEELKKKVRAVLLSKIGGVPLERFPEDYKKLEGKPLHYKELGFKKLREFLEAMPDAVRFEYKEKAGLWMLYGVGDQKSFMSSAAKKAQYSRPSDGIKDKNKMTKGKKSPGGKNFKKNSNKEKEATPPSTSTNGNDPEHCVRPPSTGSQGEHSSSAGKPGGETDGTESELRVARSQRGLYTVCVRLEEFRGHQRIPFYVEEITELFAAQGDVFECCLAKSLIFCRFKEEREAIAVIKNYNGRCLQDGNRIRVTAANEKLPADKGDAPANKPAAKEDAIKKDHRIERNLNEGTEQRTNGLPNGISSEPVDILDNTVDICVFNLQGPVHSEDIMALFWQFKPLHASVRHSKNDFYCFVSFSCLAHACDAIKNLQGVLVNGLPIRIELSKRKSRASVQDRPTDGQVECTENNQKKARTPSRNGKHGKGTTWNQRTSPKSEDDSCDSITPEITGSQNAVSPPHIHNAVPVIDDSPYAARTHPQPKSDQDSSRITNTFAPEGPCMGRGRGRGVFSARSSPSFGRGLANLYPESGKKKPRPSIANLSLDDL